MKHAFLRLLHAVWFLIALIASVEVAQADPITVTFSAGVSNVSTSYSEGGFLFQSSSNNLLFFDSGGKRYLRWTGNYITITRLDGGLFDFDSFFWSSTTQPANQICPFPGGCSNGYKTGLQGLNILPSTFDDISSVLIDPNFYQFFAQGGSMSHATFDVQPAAVPEPSTLVLAAIGLGILIRLRRRTARPPS